MYGFAPNVKPNPQHAVAVAASAATINVAVLRIMKLTLNFYAFGFKTWRSQCCFSANIDDAGTRGDIDGDDASRAGKHRICKHASEAGHTCRSALDRNCRRARVR